ncbi:Uncharacterised protein [Mycobacteroides abscessus subsp. abscessus]|nr:Uncharacterised protein [Mycobacteroides abscessus subsp. abscessus]
MRLRLGEVELGEPPELLRAFVVEGVDIGEEPQQRRIVGARALDEAEPGFPVLRIGTTVLPLILGEEGGEVGEDREHE